MRWKLNRGGFFNFWKHEDTEFIFEDGNLLLHGPNGSGKTMSMTSLITPVLDGRTSPERLDPFESRSRKMRDVLLGKQNAPLTDGRIGYMYLEYRKGVTNQYLTTIIGLEAHPNKTTPTFWGCFLLDNKRVGVGTRNLSLYKVEVLHGKTVKVPLTKQQLIEAVGQSGFVVDKAEDYMKNVNKYLFGFATVEKYQDFIKLLIQLRTPKLSSAKTTGIKPSTLNEILSESLPDITMEDLRPLIETIETIDNIKKEIDQQKIDKRLIAGISLPYEEYNELLLYSKAKNLIDSDKKLRGQLNKESDLKRELQTNQDQLKKITEEINKLETTLAATDETIRSLEANQDVFSLQQEQAKLTENQHAYQVSINDRRDKLSKNNESVKNYDEQIQQWNEAIAKAQTSLRSNLNELNAYAEEMDFRENQHLSDFFEQQYENTTFTFIEWKKEVSQHENQMKAVAQLAKTIERIREDRKGIKQDIDKVEAERDELLKARARLEKKYEEELNLYLCEVNEWMDNLVYLPLSEGDKEKLRLFVQRLYFKVTEDHVLQFLTDKYEKEREAIQAKLVHLQVEWQLQDDKRNRIEDEITYWEAGNEPIPVCSEEKLSVRNVLLEEGIQFIPFYEAVEFLDDDIDGAIKARIESAITEAGLLNSIIVAAADEEYVSKKTIVAKSNHAKHSNNLTKYLRVSEIGLSLEEQIGRVLEGISIEEKSDGFILESGEFYSHFIYGQAHEIERPKYLGETARLQYRDHILAELKDSYKQLEDKVLEIDSLIVDGNREIDFLVKEREEFPSGEHLKEVKKEIDGLDRYLKDYFEKRLNELEEQLREINVQITIEENQLRTELKDTKFRVESPYSLFEECLERITEYKIELQSLELHTSTFYSASNHVKQVTEWIEELESLNTSYHEEISSINMKMDKEGIRYENIEKQLAAKGGEEITSQLNKYTELKQEIPDKIKVKQKENEKIMIAQANNLRLLKDNQQKIPLTKELVQVAENIFRKDLTFHMVRWGEKDLIQQAKELSQEISEKYPNVLPDLYNRIGYLESRIYETYNQAFRAIKSYQSDFSRSIDEDTILNEWGGIENESILEEHYSQFNQLKRYANRIVITMTRIENGVELELSPKIAIEKLDADIVLQEMRMSEKDKELYEKFLLQDLRQVIYDRIGDVGYWIKEMNSIMSQVRTSSKLSLKIKWVPISEDTEEEIHTRKLVKLLSMDAEILHEYEKEQMITHFRSKITRKLQLAERSGERLKSFKEVIHEVFDYRKWFNFEIHAKLKNDDLGHLTNKVYYGLSGGEKAISMYIPLLAAVYSRYSEADEDCPRLITLDEAFAGVDENNISEIFGMLKQLDFDYIYTSQSLWGCYETVPTLSIYDFKNAEDADQVVLFRYKWNGISKEYIGPVEPREELSSQLDFIDIIRMVDDEANEQSS
ncbi:TIGR02680 family protein [Bacillus sp. PS06]|uniref:TIGR02680 family protein n=1 Tax=Bacillus sp. PS06 TaxID=2764176 RepID=UPI001CD84146|nr:TIGR02680 family protein [Bacillus sp. PS06]